MNAVLSVMMIVSLGLSRVAPIENRTTWTTFYGEKIYVTEEREWKLTGGHIENEYVFNTYKEYEAWRG